jgi:hypothetical protein
MPAKRTPWEVFSIVPVDVLTQESIQRSGQSAAEIACQFRIAWQKLEDVNHNLPRSIAEFLLMFLHEF